MKTDRQSEILLKENKNVPVRKEETEVDAEGLHEIVWATDNEGNTTYVSPRIFEIFGYDPSKVYDEGGHLRVGRVSPENIENMKRAFEELFEKNTDFDLDFRIRKHDGKWIWLDHERRHGAKVSKEEQKKDLARHEECRKGSSDVNQVQGVCERKRSQKNKI